MTHVPVHFSIPGPNQPPESDQSDYNEGIDLELGSVKASLNLQFSGQTGTTANIVLAGPTGTPATMTSATDALAGLMAALDKEKIDRITITAPVNLDDLATDVGEHQTLFGVGDGSTNLGTFTSASTSYDGLDVKAVLQQLISSFEAGPMAEQHVVDDIAERDGLTPDNAWIAWVADASADATVNSGSAMYVYNGAASSWVKVAEFESVDVTTDLGQANHTATSLDLTSSAGAPTTLPGATNALAGLATGPQITNLESLIALSGQAPDALEHPAFANGILLNGTTAAIFQQLEGLLQPEQSTSTAIKGLTDPINATGKYRGKRVELTDRGGLTVEARGSTANAIWSTDDNVTQFTPV